MYDPERIGALSETQLLLVLREMGLTPEEDAPDRAAVATLPAGGNPAAAQQAEQHGPPEEEKKLRWCARSRKFV